jgi:hypothetical protein
MSFTDHRVGAATNQRPAIPAADSNWVGGLMAPGVRFPRIGVLGLITDLRLFTIVAGRSFGRLVVRPPLLGYATVVTGRLNRPFTLDRSSRRPADEVTRYAIATTAARGTIYTVTDFVLMVLCGLSHAILLISAAAGAIVSYNGHHLFAFAPERCLGASASERAQP